MGRKLYCPDHTAHIRAELARQAMYFTSVLVVVLAAAATTLLIAQVADLAAAPGWLVRAVWIVGAFAVTVCVVGLAAVGARWVGYLRRRAELDAAGAQAVGEVYARQANRGRREQ